MPAWKQIPNHPTTDPAKIRLRQFALNAVGAHNASVFDAYAGQGDMFRAVWSAAANYTSCDLKQTEPFKLSHRGDNAQVMRSLDLSQFNVFDFDAFGSPWSPILVLAERRKLFDGETVAVVITEGTAPALQFAAMPKDFAALARLDVNHVPREQRAPYLLRNRPILINRALANLALMMNATINSRCDAKVTTNANLAFITIILTAAHNPAKPTQRLWV